MNNLSSFLVWFELFLAFLLTVANLALGTLTYIDLLPWCIGFLIDSYVRYTTAGSLMDVVCRHFGYMLGGSAPLDRAIISHQAPLPFWMVSFNSRTIYTLLHFYREPMALLGQVSSFPHAA